MEFNASDILDSTEVTVYQYYGTFVFAISVLFELFYALIVLLTINKNLFFFRVLTCLYILFGILAEITYLCWKPVRLTPLTIIFPVGLMAPMTSTTSGVLLSLFALSLALMVECLVLIITERHFHIISTAGVNVRIRRIWMYTALAITFGTAGTLFFIYVLSHTDDAVVIQILKSRVANADIILAKQSSMFNLNVTISTWLLVTLFFLFIYVAYRIGLLIYVMKDYAAYTKTSQHKFSERTRKH